MIDQSIRDNIAAFYDPIEMPGGWTFDTAEQIKTNNLYYLGKFKSGQYDEQGFRKFNFNQIKPACDIATKFIDLNVKDIITSAVRDGDEIPVFFMQRRLRQYLLDVGFGKLLNEIGQEYPKGHVILKWAKKKHSFVNIDNIRTDTTVEWLKDSGHVYEVHRKNRGELNSTGWNVKELLWRYPDKQDFVVYECYEKEDGKWNRVIKGDLFARKKDGGTQSGTEALINDKTADFADALVLAEDKNVKFPYRELKWENVKGRWYGYGFPELLEDNQIATNEAENLERKGLMFTSLKLYQTRDESIGGSNVLTNAQNGDIIKTNQEIQPLAMEERNLAAFNATRGRWDKNTEQKTFSFDIARGENLPSRTPVGVANLSASMVTSYFELKRQNFGLFIKELLLEDIIPEFQNDTAEEHVMMVAGSDEEIERLDNLLAEDIVNKAALAEAEKTGFLPSEARRNEAKLRVTKQLKKKVNRYLKIMKDYFKNVKYILDINIVGEGFDLNKNNEGINFAMQTLAGNPGILQNQTTRTLFFDLMEKNGYSPVKLNMMKDNIDETPVPQAGSMARPGQAQSGFGAKEQVIQ